MGHSIIFVLKQTPNMAKRAKAEMELAGNQC